MENFYLPHFAREHMELLDAVEQYGYGNWGDIAKKVTCSRRAVGQTGQQGGQRLPERRASDAVFVTQDS